MRGRITMTVRTPICPALSCSRERSTTENDVLKRTRFVMTQRGRSRLLPMKPGDHPEFFKFPAPEGRSRESEIRLDADGHFHDHGAEVEHARLAQAMHTWIARHPDDGRYILTNGYDWTYFVVDDAPYFVRSVKVAEKGVTLVLSDETEEPLVPAETVAGAFPKAAGNIPAGTAVPEALYTAVKRDAKGGPFAAKFTRHAQASLGPALAANEEGKPGVVIDGELRLFAEEIR